ncbi:MAG TPA: hypothetical protein DCY13_24965 [Verrucomicrobiales bacterium]|nr:hypothetical protein [Verrucomicrobiales bacterium]
MSSSKRFRTAFALFLLAVAVSGCSGINASRSVSPADFLLPGLTHAAPAEPVQPLNSDGSAQVALLSTEVPQ